MNIRLTLSTLLISALFFAAGPIEAYAQTATSYSTTDFTSQVVQRTNVDRTTAGLGSITLNAILSAAAQQKANDMMQNQYFAHVSPSGVLPWHWFKAGGYTYIYAGENLAMDFYSPQTVETAWMNSPTHRANILNGTYKDIGIGIAQGTYQGKSVIFIVEFFGTQASSTSIAKTKAVTRTATTIARK